MARTYLFLTHGVGAQDPDSWWKDWKKALFKALKQYAPFAQKSDAEVESDYLKIVPISYDSVFQGLRTQWQRDAKALSENATMAEFGLSDSFGWVADQASSLKNAFWDYALDAVLWYGLPMARAAVQAHVAPQIAAGLRDMIAEGGAGAHLVAHSLGTSVMHDSLIGLVAAASIHRGSLSPNQVRLKSVTMLANTSRLLEAWRDVDANNKLEAYQSYLSVLRPGTPASIVDTFLNCRHQIDPITWPRRFAPAHWQDAQYSDLMIANFADPKKVHDATHYLADPRVHVRVLRMVLSNARLGTDAEISAALSAHSASHQLSLSTLHNDLKLLFSDDSNKRLTIRQLTEFLSNAYGALT